LKVLEQKHRGKNRAQTSLAVQATRQTSLAKAGLPTSAVPDVTATIAAVYGCKWSLKIFELIQRGICRPGAIEAALPGLTTRVQNYYFKRMMALGVLNKATFPEVPPRVEYAITPYGLSILKILESIGELQSQIELEHHERIA
jgi:DNA-binding HxlR family transcriptional regulator